VHEQTSFTLAFYNNISQSGGPPPVRAYIEELLPDVLEARIQTGRVFDRVIGLEEVRPTLSCRGVSVPLSARGQSASLSVRWGRIDWALA